MEKVEEQRLSDVQELYKISERTNSDGTVQADVLGWERNGDYVGIEYEVCGETGRDKFEWPKRDSEEYDFVRITREYCGGLVNAETLTDRQIKVKETSTGWSIVVPENKTKTDKVAERFDSVLNHYGPAKLSVVLIAVMPIIPLLLVCGFPFFLEIMFGDANVGRKSKTMISQAVVLGTAALCWSFLIAAVL